MLNDNLSRLSLKLLATHLAENGGVCLDDKGYRKAISGLPDKLQEQVSQFFEDLQSVVPNDFDTSVSFGLAGARLSIEFVDGNTGCSAGRWLFTSRKSMRRKLREVAWDSARAELLRRGGVFDEMLSKADDRPPNIPSSREAAERYQPELDAMLAKVKTAENSGPFVLVLARANEGVEGDYYDSRQAVVNEIGDAMTTGYEVLAVIENGAAWTFEAIEAAKLEAVEGLSPISRAKAERRLPLVEGVGHEFR